MLLDIADQPVASQRRDVRRRAVAFEVSRARIDSERVVGELAGDKASRLRLVEADHDVDLAPGEGRQLGQRHQLQTHARMALGEVAQHACQIIGREPVGRADAHVARELEIDAGDFALCVQERALHLLGRSDEPLASAGQLRAGRTPIEELGAERNLERRDAAADRRVVELEPLGGGDELPPARDGKEDPDVVPVHGGRDSGSVSPDLDPDLIIGQSSRLLFGRSRALRRGRE